LIDVQQIAFSASPFLPHSAEHVPNVRSDSLLDNIDSPLSTPPVALASAIHRQSSNDFRMLPGCRNGMQLSSSDSCKLMLKKQEFLKLIYWQPQSTSFYTVVKLALAIKSLFE